ncbi:hypothetical protein BD289DRAFT_442736 [Coniella lustricola]|uniref:Uncharacterized protein n=1 Tax=Coniella lustricola TaxID=2025994 RepID=A0A2T2ZXZ4_9PEZI|nr:hypothetical protein BD289DRAFT_442736 [Coniella lustricola]
MCLGLAVELGEISKAKAKASLASRVFPQDPLLSRWESLSWPVPSRNVKLSFNATARSLTLSGTRRGPLIEERISGILPRLSFWRPSLASTAVGKQKPSSVGGGNTGFGTGQTSVTREEAVMHSTALYRRVFPPCSITKVPQCSLPWKKVAGSKSETSLLCMAASGSLFRYRLFSRLKASFARICTYKTHTSMHVRIYREQPHRAANTLKGHDKAAAALRMAFPTAFSTSRREKTGGVHSTR